MYTQPVALVVQASVNDYQTTTESVVAAARVLVTHARSIDKKIPIAIVGPIYYQYEAQPALLSQRLGLKQLAKELKVTYVDPTGWITDDTKALYIGSDNLHPTAAGYQRIASKLATALRQFASDLP
jgi:lysophospholipase L1-like esterase